MRVDIKQSTDEWHKWRAGGIGASDAGTILGMNPYKTPYQFWLQRTGKVQSETQNAAMLHGLQFEDDARAHFIGKTGKGLTPACYQHDDYPFMRASLDGISWDESFVADLKCPQPHNFDRILRLQQAPVYWELQIQYQLACCPATSGALSVYSSDSRMSVDFEYEQDADIQEQLVEAAHYMWTCIQADTPPKLEDGELEFREMESETEYYRLCLEEARIKKRKETLRDEILAASNGRGFRTQHYTIKPSMQERVNWRAYAESLDPSGSLRAEHTKQVESWAIRPRKRYKHD